MLKTEGYENSQLFMALTPKNGVKASKLYSYKPIDGTGDFHWSRNHTAYRLNQEGVLELMGNNVPRVDYTNTCPELLIEKASANLILHSENFSNASWVKTNVNITPNSTNAPNGSLTADTLTDTTLASSEFSVNQLATVIDGEIYTFSIYLKSNTTNLIMCRFFGLDAEKYYCVVLNLDTGLATKVQSGSLITSANYEITSLNNGWIKLEVTANLNTSSGGIRPVIQFVNSSNPTIGLFGEVSYSGTSSNSIYIWGAQLEESDYATSYIPTTTTTQTRPQDVCYNTANGYNDADWSVVMRVRLNNIGSSADEPLLALSDGTTDYYFAIYTDSNPKLHFTWYNNPDQDTYSTTDLNNGIVNVGVSFDSVTAEYIIVIDGTLFDSGTLVNNAPGLFGNFNRLDLGSIVGTGSPDRDGIIGIQYYDSALIQSDLENLTS